MSFNENFLKKAAHLDVENIFSKLEIEGRLNLIISTYLGSREYIIFEVLESSGFIAKESADDMCR